MKGNYHLSLPQLIPVISHSWSLPSTGDRVVVVVVAAAVWLRCGWCVVDGVVAWQGVRAAWVRARDVSRGYIDWAGTVGGAVGGA